METVIKIIFNKEGDAFAAQNALLRASNNFEVELNETYIIKTSADDTAVVISEDDEQAGEGILGGTALGGLLGLLGGPVGLGLGMMGGMLAGTVGDLARDEDITDYLDKYAKELSTGETMLVAHLWEYSTYATDDLLKPYGGRVTRLDVDVEVYKAQQAELDAIDQEIEASEAAWATAKAEDKAAFEAKLNQLKQKREATKAKFKNWTSDNKRRFEDWKTRMDDKLDAAKRARLEKHMSKKAEELEQLQEKYDAI
jgi:uncharacterized membrane protein